jgi:hypothetical protein
VPFVLYRANGLLWSLAVCSLLVPLLDRLLPAARYQWTPAAPTSRPEKGHTHETLPAAPRLRPAAVPLTAAGA